MAKQLTITEKACFNSAGGVGLTALLPERVLQPVRGFAKRLRELAPHQDLLSGIHNPFGYHACVEQAWSFLDIAEADELLNCIEDILGPDIILWDSELYFSLLTLSTDEASIWPIDPLAGAIVAVGLDSDGVHVFDITRLTHQDEVVRRCGGMHYVIRYMPATSLFDRNPRSRANRRATEVRPLINYAKRPLWLVRGEDRRGNDFATGFSLPAARWIDGGPSRHEGAAAAPVHAKGA
jgi:hypothetical protein